MAISEVDKKRISKWCEAQTPVEHLASMRVEATFRGNSAEIFDVRPPWHPDLGDEWTWMRVAKVTWAPSTNTWALFAVNRHDKLIHYSEEMRTPSTLIGVLRVIESDPTCIFWG